MKTPIGEAGTKPPPQVNWLLVRAGLSIVALGYAFILGRLSVEFKGSRADWMMLILGIITLIASVIGIAASELARKPPAG